MESYSDNPSWALLLNSPTDLRGLCSSC